MSFPLERSRRLRRSASLRQLVRETELSTSNLILPLFVKSTGDDEAIQSMPGVCRYSPARVAEVCTAAFNLGLPGVILFGIPEFKDAQGSASWQDDGVVQRAIREIKNKVPELLVIADVCLCEYTDHGHCGVIKDGAVDNDATLELLVKQALSFCHAGADIVAPSDMMDGRVGAVRRALDEAGFTERAILAYSAKYASAFYGPFREAAGSTPAFGDRRGYQMDPANAREALREVRLDIEEGADIVMVKPALAYLDVIQRVRETTDLPIAAFNVSGEYSMVKAAAAAGMLDERTVALEILTAIKRAGADLILTYHALEVARWQSTRNRS
ncbi:MAG: porphobilinogen synthase [bacterium]